MLVHPVGSKPDSLSLHITLCAVLELKGGEGLKLKGTGRYRNGKVEIAGSRRSTPGCILTCPRLAKKENL